MTTQIQFLDPVTKLMGYKGRTPSSLQRPQVFAPQQILMGILSNQISIFGLLIEIFRSRFKIIQKEIQMNRSHVSKPQKPIRKAPKKPKLPSELASKLRNLKIPESLISQISITHGLNLSIIEQMSFEVCLSPDQLSRLARAQVAEVQEISPQYLELIQMQRKQSQTTFDDGKNSSLELDSPILYS